MSVEFSVKIYIFYIKLYAYTMKFSKNVSKQVKIVLLKKWKSKKELKGNTKKVKKVTLFTLELKIIGLFGKIEIIG